MKTHSALSSTVLRLPSLLFVGGGSLGHITPAVAVWRVFEHDHPTIEKMFLCSERTQDREYLLQEGISPFTIPPIKLTPTFPYHILCAFITSHRLLKKLQPTLIFSKGGSPSIPLCLLAWMRGTPFILHESDSVMGYANFFLSTWARVVCLGFPIEDMRHETLDIISKVQNLKSKVYLTGNPIRPDILRGSKIEGLRITGFRGTRPILLVLGGSQGAETLNTVVVRYLPELITICDVIHITGTGKTSATPQDGYWVRECVFEELPHLYAVSSMALSRAGAGAISELAAWGIPTILVPLRRVGHDHQEHNAQELEKINACILLEQEDLGEQLVKTVQELLTGNGQRETLSRNIHQFHHPDAAGHIANIILQNLA